MSGGSRAVFLDRDGVLNEVDVRGGVPHPPARVPDVKMLPGAVDACHRLVADGWMLVVVTNQPDIARGIVTRSEVDAINRQVTADLNVAEVVVCPHDDDDDCSCRKPRSGMILDAAERWGIDCSRSATVGDRWRDIEAGQGAGTTTYFVDRGYSEQRPDNPDHFVGSLTQAADLLTGTEGPA